jgi:hypothetical protein
LINTERLSGLSFARWVDKAGAFVAYVDTKWKKN